jgi:biotin transport system substrate-specific component
MGGTGIEDTLAAAIWPHRGEAKGKESDAGPSLASRFLREAALSGLGVGLLTLSAKISVPLLPVPMTLQSLAVLCLGAAYGMRLAAITVMAYLACGLCGLPVFANTPPLAAGIAYLLGPTGGFLIGFIPAAMFMGLIAEAKLDRSFAASLPAALLAAVMIMACGFVWLAFAAKVGARGHGLGAAVAWSKGVAPFVIGDSVKAALTAALFPALWSLMGSRAAP